MRGFIRLGLAEEELRGLQSLYGEVEAAATLRFLFEERLGKGWRSQSGLKTAELRQLKADLERLQKGEPIQHILGKAYFLDLQLRVNTHTLIPRPETEELVDTIRRSHPQGAPLRILDIGTGSGCIAIALKRYFKKAEVHALDISEKALNVAAENARLNQVELEFLAMDILIDWPKESYWDIIVSNPPYIRPSESEQMLPNVLEHEPHLALFIPEEDPLLFYRRIAGEASFSLRSGGRLYFEINRQYGSEIAALVEELGFAATLQRDMQGEERMLIAQKK